MEINDPSSGYLYKHLLVNASNDFKETFWNR